MKKPLGLGALMCVLIACDVAGPADSDGATAGDDATSGDETPEDPTPDDQERGTEELDQFGGNRAVVGTKTGSWHVESIGDRAELLVTCDDCGAASVYLARECRELGTQRARTTMYHALVSQCLRRQS